MGEDGRNMVEIEMTSTESEEEQEEAKEEFSGFQEFDAELLYRDQVRQPSMHHDAIMRSSGFYNQLSYVEEEEKDEEIRVDEHDEGLVRVNNSQNEQAADEFAEGQAAGTEVKIAHWSAGKPIIACFSIIQGDAMPHDIPLQATGYVVNAAAQVPG